MRIYLDLISFCCCCCSRNVLC